jgi:hypothetical protein
VAGCWSSGCRRPGFRAGVARRRRPGGLEGVGVSVPAGSLRVVRRALRMMRAGMLKRIRPSGGRGAAAVGGQPAMTRAAGRSYGSPSRLASAATGRSGTFHRPTTRREVAPLQDIAAGAVQVVVLIRVPGQQAIKIRGHLPLKIIGGPMSQQTRRSRFPMRGRHTAHPRSPTSAVPLPCFWDAGRRDLALTTPGSISGKDSIADPDPRAAPTADDSVAEFLSAASGCSTSTTRGTSPSCSPRMLVRRRFLAAPGSEVAR